MSDDDWRVRVIYPGEKEGRDLQRGLEAGTVDPDLEHHGVILSNESDADELFLYAGTREYAERAEKAVKTAADAWCSPVGKTTALTNEGT